MKRVVALVPCIFALACSRKAELPSGTVHGESFAPIESVAVVSSVATCAMSGSTLSVSNLALAFRDAPGLCETAAQPCLSRPNARTVAVLLNAQGAQPQAPIGPGRYPVVADGAGLQPNANGAFVYGLAFSVRTDATCAEAEPPTMLSGTVEITSISGDTVKGQVDLASPGGDALRGAFEASVCAQHPTACDAMAAGCTGTRTCM